MQQEDDTADTDSTDTEEEQVVPELTPKQRAEQSFYYFNLGFEGDQLAANFTNCAIRAIYWRYIERVTYDIKIRYGTGFENTLNSTLFLQNTTDVLHICTDTMENIYYYYLFKQEQFPTVSDLALGFLQNLLSNGMRLNAINSELQRLVAEE